MAQKVNPTALRLGLTLSWSSRWFSKKDRGFLLEEDHLIRKLITQKILAAGIARIEIERTSDAIRVSITAGRPGLIIGRGGKGIEELKETLLRRLRELRREKRKPLNFSLQLNVEELKRSELSANIIAQQIAFDIERRLPYRRVMKRHLELMQQNRGTQGAKIRLSGRLNGAEISRREWLLFGKLPLQNLRANIDYGEATSFNTYGTIGVKVWMYKGEIFD